MSDIILNRSLAQLAFLYEYLFSNNNKKLKSLHICWLDIIIIIIIIITILKMIFYYY